ncbi:hypothetical protein VTI74DRAFT_7752 [Chaetomium olivicolor]
MMGKIMLTADCSTHVHVSRHDLTFTAEQLKGICKGVCYYEEPITKVMPSERKETSWAVSNVLGEAKQVNQKLRRAYRLVPETTWAPLFKILGKITLKTVQDTLARTSRGDDRYLSWNFENITQPCGTIEFRRPPAVASAADACHWAAFSVGFIARAMGADWTRIESLNTVGSVAELRKFVAQGVEILGPTCVGALIEAKLVEDFSPAQVLTPAELEDIEQKKLEKNTKNSPFVEKASSRPSSPALSVASLASLRAC